MSPIESGPNHTVPYQMKHHVSLRKSSSEPRNLPQLIRYGLVGVVSNSVGYMLYLMLTHAGIEPKLTAFILYAAGATIGYFGNKKWTFSHNGPLFSSTAKYVGMQASGYGINFAILWVLHDRLRYPHQYAQLFAIPVVAIFLFFASKYFVFKRVMPSDVGRA